MFDSLIIETREKDMKLLISVSYKESGIEEINVLS